MSNMTARDALTDGRLFDAIAEQEAAVRERPDDPAARLFLFELLTLAGRLSSAFEQLRQVQADEPEWPQSRRAFHRLLKAEHRRTVRGRRPQFLTNPPQHARHRWAVVRAARSGDSIQAVTEVDRSDATTPVVFGHVDGREFEGMRDADDRFGSVLEVFVGADYVWVPFESVRRVTFEPVAGVLDTVYRPARLRLADETELRAILPLVYPNSVESGEAFALGIETDWEERNDLVFGTGGRLLLTGEEEVMMSECRQLDISGPR